MSLEMVFFRVMIASCFEDSNVFRTAENAVCSSLVILVGPGPAIDVILELDVWADQSAMLCFLFLYARSVAMDRGLIFNYGMCHLHPSGAVHSFDESFFFDGFLLLTSDLHQTCIVSVRAAFKNVDRFTRSFPHGL